MNIIFSGTPEFSVLSLEYIHKNFNLKAVITKPDRPSGRGLKVRSSPIKTYALDNKIKYFQPVDLKDPELIKSIRGLEPDFIIDVSYGRIMPEELLKLPKNAAINIHPSLLPGYKGPSPIRWVLINGEDRTGVSSHIMTEKIDEGRIIYRKKVSLDADTTYDTLYNQLSGLCVNVIKLSLEKFLKNNFTSDTEDIYKIKNFNTRKLEKKDIYINWNKSSFAVNNLVKALNSKPAAHTLYNNSPIKIYKTEVLNDFNSDGKFRPGEITTADRKNGIIIKTRDGFLKIIELQKQNKKILNYREFLNGTKLNIKEKFQNAEN